MLDHREIWRACYEHRDPPPTDQARLNRERRAAFAQIATETERATPARRASAKAT